MPRWAAHSMPIIMALLHALAEQHELASALAHRLHGEGFMPSSFPLFPAADGTEVAKAAVVLAIETVAEALGLPLYTAGGQRRFGGHSMRVTGAQFLAQRGLDLSISSCWQDGPVRWWRGMCRRPHWRRLWSPSKSPRGILHT
eukprot:4685690-Amphidinium_carterae.1